MTEKEYKTAERCKKDYRLYRVFNSTEKPKDHARHASAWTEWKSFSKVEHYHLYIKDTVSETNA